MNKQQKKEGITIILVYLFTWLVSLTFVIYLYIKDGSSLTESLNGFIEIISQKQAIIPFHILFSVFFFLFIIIRYFIRTYKKRGFKIMFKHFLLRLFMPVFLLFFTYKSIVYANTNEDYTYKWDYSIENTTNKSKNLYKIDKKHRGMHVFGWWKNTNKTINELLKNNVEWVAVVPFLYQENERAKVMRTPKVIGEWSREDSVFINAIKDNHKKEMRIMLKPHLWLGEGWRSNVTMDTDEEWDNWFDSYRKNMIHYAMLAEINNVELLCIGTELRTSMKQQPKKWIALIKDIKSIYSGKLTYAANWDDENDLEDFWSALDYIGIQAYFPLTNSKNPDLETIKTGWNTHINSLESLSKKYNKPILFTEVGYKSEISATIKPWEWDSFSGQLTRKKSDKTQQLAYQGLFESLWTKDWFAGLYIWQWQSRSKKENAAKNLDFSPRFKPAENTIAKWFSKPANKISSIILEGFH